MKFLLTIIAVSVLACAQDKKGFDKHTELDPEVIFDRFPHAYLMPALSLNGGGFQASSASITGGVMYELPYISLETRGTYNAARKVFDGTGDNPHGHVRSVGAKAFIRLPNLWLIGADYGYGALSTTNYNKTSGGWSYGGGRDLILSDTSMRLTALYSPPHGPENSPSAGDRSQGLTVTFILPSPITKHRVYFYEVVSGSRFRDGQSSGGMHMGLLFKF